MLKFLKYTKVKPQLTKKDFLVHHLRLLVFNCMESYGNVSVLIKLTGGPAKPAGPGGPVSPLSP